MEEVNLTSNIGYYEMPNSIGIYLKDSRIFNKSIPSNNYNRFTLLPGNTIEMIVDFKQLTLKYIIREYKFKCNEFLSQFKFEKGKYKIAVSIWTQSVVSLVD